MFAEGPGRCDDGGADSRPRDHEGNAGAPAAGRRAGSDMLAIVSILVIPSVLDIVIAMKERLEQLLLADGRLSAY